MKKGLALAALVALFLAVPAKSRAHSYDPDDSDYPLRYIAYVVHPVGVAIQDWVLRPIHRFVSKTQTRAYWFGHEPREGSLSRSAAPQGRQHAPEDEQNHRGGDRAHGAASGKKRSPSSSTAVTTM